MPAPAGMGAVISATPHLSLEDVPLRPTPCRIRPAGTAAYSVALESWDLICVLVGPVPGVPAIL